MKKQILISAVVLLCAASMSYAQGQGMGMMQEPQIKPEIAYLEYLTENDARVRPSHRKMHGIIRPIDDPIWQIWWPPNGYNCRCRIRIITWVEAERRGIQPTPIVPTVLPDDGFISGPGQWNFAEIWEDVA